VEVKCTVAVAPSIDIYDRSMHERATAAIEEAKATGLTGVLVASRETTTGRSAA
jgi:D-aminopeptidase